MNKLTIIGNLTRDPELRTTPAGISVCTFSVAVNRRRTSQTQGQPEADFFRVTAWRQLGENCQKYLSKGRKVCVIGAVSLSTYVDREGQNRASLEVTADDIEFLTPRSEDGGYTPATSAVSESVGTTPMGGGFTQVDEDELPF